MGWNTTKTVGGHTVYDTVPTITKAKKGTVVLSTRTWCSPTIVADDTELHVFCRVGSLSRRNPAWAVVRHPDGSVNLWPAQDNEKK